MSSTKHKSNPNNPFTTTLKEFALRRKSPYVFYAIYKKDPDITDPEEYLKTPPLYITGDKVTLEEAISRIIYFNRQSHFEMWCKTRGLEPVYNTQSWYDYVGTVVIPAADWEDYAVLSTTYDKDVLASCLRCMSGCNPLFTDEEDSNDWNCAIACWEGNIPDEYVKAAKYEPDVAQKLGIGKK